MNCDGKRKGKGKETHPTDGMFIIAHSREFTMEIQSILGLVQVFFFPPSLGKLLSLPVTITTCLPFHRGASVQMSENLVFIIATGKRKTEEVKRFIWEI